MGRHTGRVALVTGAAGNIGFRIAERLAQEGATTVLTDLVPDVTVRADSLQADGRVADIAQEGEIGRLIADIVTRHGGIDILVNNAAISPKSSLRPRWEIALSEWQSVLQVNLTAPFLLCRACIPVMQRGRWGRIVNISSQAGRTSTRLAGLHYGASKAGLIGLTRHLAAAVAGDGITVNAVAPGPMERGMASGSADTPAVDPGSVYQIPVGRPGAPADIAAAVSFLAADEAGFITGATVDVNGGTFMA